MRLSLLDASNSAAGTQAWMRSGTTVAQAESAAPTLIGPIAALSDAAIQSWHVVYRGTESPRPDASGITPAASAGVFIFSCDSPDTYAIVSVPGIKTDFLLSAGPGAGILIDLAAAEVISFIDLMVAGIWCNPFGVQLLELESAYMQWRP